MRNMRKSKSRVVLVRERKDRRLIGKVKKTLSMFVLYKLSWCKNNDQNSYVAPEMNKR